MGRPAATKLQGRSRPQREQVASGPWKQPSQSSPWPSWARRAIGRSRPQPEQVLLGRGAQTAHNASPAGPRPATGLTTPQRAQATAVWCLRHGGQSPPSSEAVSSRWARPQRAQVGSGRDEPLERSSATSLPSTGGAPANSAPGPGSRALASTDSALAFVATASMAELTCPVDSAGSACATRRVTKSLQACWSFGVTSWGPPGPGGGGCRPPRPGPTRAWPAPPCARLGPAPPALPG